MTYFSIQCFQKEDRVEYSCGCELEFFCLLQDNLILKQAKTIWMLMIIYIRLHLHLLVLNVAMQNNKLFPEQGSRRTMINILGPSSSFHHNLSCEELSFKLQTWLFAYLNLRKFSPMHLASYIQIVLPGIRICTQVFIHCVSMWWLTIHPLLLLDMFTIVYSTRKILILISLYFKICSFGGII